MDKGDTTAENLPSFDKTDADLACEDAIMREKERFGRVRTSFMKKLRHEYGEKMANTALTRINKRVSTGSLRIKHHLEIFNYE